MFNKEKFMNGLGLCKRAGKLVYGDGLIPAIQKKTVYMVIVGNNASERTKKQLRDKAATAQIDVIDVLSVEELSWAIGMDRVSVGVTDKHLLNVLKNNL